MFKRKKAFLTIIIPLWTIGLLTCVNDSDDRYGTAELTFDKVKVALYIDDAVWPDCVVNTEYMLHRTGLPYAVIHNDTLFKGELPSFSVLVMPGGRPDLLERSLGREGLSRIRNYVARGGGYIGICGGAFLAARDNIWRGWADEPRKVETYTGRLGIFPGRADGPLGEFAPTYQDFSCELRIINQEHPVTRSLPPTFRYLYDHGPMFITDNDPNAVTLATTVPGGNTLIIITTYEKGRLFLTGGHPEATHNLTCTTLMKNALLWCSRHR
jgi:glutamine amidotransferase-like uncharacterized protein